MIRVKLGEPDNDFVKAGKEELRRYRAFLRTSKSSNKTPPVKARAAGAKPGKSRRKPFKFKVYGSARESLMKTFGGKCAYCEGLIENTQPGDVEHYRPKGGVLVDGELKPGYYWLAATWDNLLISCIDCNRQRKQLIKGLGRVKAGKLNQFPLVEEKKTRQEAEGCRRRSPAAH
jgi:uncharacterized protein (TIGR02646 family)